MSNGDDSPKVTTASVDRRIERLEDAVGHLQDSYNDLDRKIDRVSLGQDHLKELLDAKLATHDSKIDGLSNQIENLVTTKIDTLIKIIADAQIEGARMMGDIQATPAGRLVKEEIDELKVGREADASRIEALERKQIAVAAGLAVVIFFVNLLAPVLQGLLGISH